MQFRSQFILQSLRLLAFAAAVFAIFCDVAEADYGCPVTGKYSVIGRGPRATNSYQGEASISESGGACRVEWFPPNTSRGSGEYANGVLTVHFTFASGQTGVVRYTRAPNGDLHGVWWTDDKPSVWGTESLFAH
jgi:hypothetical protein